MSYSVEYINCKICGSDSPKFLGLRGNLEYLGAPRLSANQEHMVTNIVKCRKCGFVYTNPRIIIPPEKIVHFYDEPDEYHSSIYDEDPLKIFNYTLNMIERFVEQKGRLLDIGAGKGEFLAAAKMRGWEVFGIEPSKKFVDYAKQKYALSIRNCELERADFSNDYFDVVTLNMVLEHIEDPHNLISQINGILRKGGLLYIEVPNMDSLLLKLIKIYYRFKGKDWSPLLSPLHYPYHYYGYTISSLKLLCNLNSFTIIKFFVSGIGLRGFRPKIKLNRFKKSMINLLVGIFACINQGDILVAIVTKR